MRVLIVTAGSHGDVHPFLAIGRALAERGHNPTFMTNPYFEPDVHAAGLDFQPHGDHIDLPAFIRTQKLMHPIRGPANVFRWILQNTPALLAEVDEAIAAHTPDVVLHHAIALGVPWLCARRELPYATACLQPAVWFSRTDPVPSLQRDPRPGDAGVARIAQRALGPLAVAAGSWRMNRLRLACGFPKQHRSIVHDFRGGDLNLGLWSPAFRPAMPDDPHRARITGFPLFDGAALRPMPADLIRFLDSGPPPVVFALGTTAVFVAGEYFRHAAEVCRRIGVRGVLLCGRPENAPSRLPPGVLAVHYAPFSGVLPRGAVSVVHGGIGSIGQALAAGRPIVVTPFSHDQFNNGVRVQRLGVGFSLGRRELTVERLEQAVRACLDDVDIGRRAATLRSAITSENGAGLAAQAVEELGARRSRPTRDQT